MVITRGGRAGRVKHNSLRTPQPPLSGGLFQPPKCDPYKMGGNLSARQFRFRDRRGGPVCPPVSVMPARLPRRGFGRTRWWQTYMSDPTKPHPLLRLGLTSERAGRFANRPYAILGRFRLPLRGLERKAEHAGRVFVQHRLYLAGFDAVFQHELNEHAQTLPGGRVVQLPEIRR